MTEQELRRRARKLVTRWRRESTMHAKAADRAMRVKAPGYREFSERQVGGHYAYAACAEALLRLLEELADD